MFLLNKCKIPRIPPLLVTDKIITDVKVKVNLSNDYVLINVNPLMNLNRSPYQ